MELNIRIFTVDPRRCPNLSALTWYLLLVALGNLSPVIINTRETASYKIEDIRQPCPGTHQVMLI